MKKKEDTNKKKISEILNEVNESMAGEEKVYDTAGDKTLYNENEAEGVDEAEQALKTDVSKIDVSSTDVTDAEITEEENNAPKPFHGNTQIILSLRVIVAGYLLYTSYSLVTLFRLKSLSKVILQPETTAKLLFTSLPYFL